MTKYANLDAFIVKTIKAGKRPLYLALCSGEAKRIAGEMGCKVFRVIDSRLQFLRKSGKIMHQDGRWSVIDKIHCVSQEEEKRMLAAAGR